MLAPYFCDRCNFETDELLDRCARCGRASMRKTSTIRRLGWVLVVLGSLLAAFMGYLTYVVAGIMARSNQPGTGARFTGDSTDAAFIYGIFGLVIALGLSFVAGGIWQIIYGRRNKKIIVLVLVLAGVLYAIGEVVQTWD